MFSQFPVQCRRAAGAEADLSTVSELSLVVHQVRLRVDVLTRSRWRRAFDVKAGARAQGRRSRADRPVDRLRAVRELTEVVPTGRSLRRRGHRRRPRWLRRRPLRRRGGAEHRHDREAQARRHLPQVGCIPAKELLETAARVPDGGQGRRVRRQGRRTDHRLVDDPGPQAGHRRPAGRGPGALLKGKKVTVLDGTGRLHAGRR